MMSKVARRELPSARVARFCRAENVTNPGPGNLHLSTRAQSPDLPEMSLLPLWPAFRQQEVRKPSSSELLQFMYRPERVKAEVPVPMPKAPLPCSPAGALSLDSFVVELADILRTYADIPLRKRFSVQALLRRLQLTAEEYEPFIQNDLSKAYTRSLLARSPDFNLLLLNWNPGAQSPIHDHPRAGCWVKVLEGNLCETRYQRAQGPSTAEAAGGAEHPLLEESGVINCSPGEVTYVQDSIGYHRMANPSSTQRAITLHVYAPAYTSCTTWQTPTSAPTTSSMTVDCDKRRPASDSNPSGRTQ